MKTFKTKISFDFDDGQEVNEVEITVPYNLTMNDVINEIHNDHDYLCFDDETDYYGINGRTPESLLNHLCDEVHEGEGWSWSGLEMDIDLELD